MSATTSLDPVQVEQPHRMPTDRRRSIRHEHIVPAWLSPEAGNPQSKQQQVDVFNLSLGGVGFTSDKPLDEGADFWIIVGNGPLHVSSRMRVVSARQRDDGRWDVGGEFF